VSAASPFQNAGDPSSFAFGAPNPAGRRAAIVNTAPLPINVIRNSPLCCSRACNDLEQPTRLPLQESTVVATRVLAMPKVAAVTEGQVAGQTIQTIAPLETETARRAVATGRLHLSTRIPFSNLQFPPLSGYR
jgi:hypothetical protein